MNEYFYINESSVIINGYRYTAHGLTDYFLAIGQAVIFLKKTNKKLILLDVKSDARNVFLKDMWPNIINLFDEYLTVDAKLDISNFKGASIDDVKKICWEGMTRREQVILSQEVSRNFYESIKKLSSKAQSFVNSKINKTFLCLKIRNISGPFDPKTTKYAQDPIFTESNSNLLYKKIISDKKFKSSDNVFLCGDDLLLLKILKTKLQKHKNIQTNFDKFQKNLILRKDYDSLLLAAADLHNLIKCNDCIFLTLKRNQITPFRSKWQTFYEIHNKIYP